MASITRSNCSKFNCWYNGKGSIWLTTRARLAEQELEINTSVAIESALNHVIDLRNVPFRPVSDDVLEIATSCLLRLNRDQEAYNYLKHWESRYRDRNRVESSDIFTRRIPSPAFLASVFLVKYRLYQPMELCYRYYLETGDCNDPRIMETLGEYVYRKLMKKGPELGDRLNEIAYMVKEDVQELCVCGFKTCKRTSGSNCLLSTRTGSLATIIPAWRPSRYSTSTGLSQLLRVASTFSRSSRSIRRSISRVK